MQFVDLSAQYQAYRADIDAAVATVLSHGKFINGPEVAAFEEELAAFAGAAHAVGCSSGTDALAMMMMVEGIGPGDAVFIPSFTFTATAEVPLLLGATPVFVEVRRDDFNIDADDLAAKAKAVRAEGRLRPAGVIATDLFGLPANYPAIRRVAEAAGMAVWADAAQSYGAALDGVRVGALTGLTGTSFFPAKPLGCYGDGGAVLTDDADKAHVLRSIRMHGKGDDKYDIVRIGLNARLDTIQAAILRVKLAHFADEIAAREQVAQAYDARLQGLVETPARPEGRSSVWAQYTIKLPADRRDAVAVAMKADGVPTAVYYPRPMHLQTAYAPYGQGSGSLPVSERLSSEVLSLPMHPFLSEAEIDAVVRALTGALGGEIGGG